MPEHDTKTVLGEGNSARKTISGEGESAVSNWQFSRAVEVVPEALKCITGGGTIKDYATSALHGGVGVASGLTKHQPTVLVVMGCCKGSLRAPCASNSNHRQGCGSSIHSLTMGGMNHYHRK